MGNPNDDICNCGHKRKDHIYCEGACRPGFVCESSCDAFAMTTPQYEKQEDCPIDMHACSTGDCLHDEQSDCDEVLAHYRGYLDGRRSRDEEVLLWIKETEMLADSHTPKNARIAELESALKPFAECLEWIKTEDLKLNRLEWAPKFEALAFYNARQALGPKDRSETEGRTALAATSGADAGEKGEK